MTNGSSNTPPEPSERPSLATRLRRFIRRPSTLIAGGVLIAVGVGGYLGVRYFVYERLSPLIETQLSNFLKRPVNLGEVESFSLTHIRFGNTSIPATPTDPDNLSLDAVSIKFNILPLLLGRPLPLDVTVVDPNVYIAQDKTGKWVNIELPEQEGELPIDLDVKINLQDADLALKPNQLNQPVTIQAQGNARYITAEPQQVQYDLNLEVLKSLVDVQGKTVLDTGQTQLNLVVNRLALAEIATLIPNNVIKLNTGTLNADLNLNVPSFEKIEGTQGQGNLSLTQIAGRLPTLQVPIAANVQLGFQGQKVLVNQFRASLNNIVAQAKGSIDWQKGYALQVQVNPFQVTNLFKILSWSLPIDVKGQLQLRLNVNGAVTDPLIYGTINNRNPIVIDKINVRNIRANFRTNLNQLLVENVRINPAAGGEITAKGQLQLGILQALKQNREIQWAKIPVNVNFRGYLPAQRLIQPYVNVPQGVTVGTINTIGKIGGTFDRLYTKAEWQTPNLATVSDVQIAGAGEIFWQRDTIIVRNTELQTEQGTLEVAGRGNTTTKQWQTALQANSFNLDPFVAIACSNFTNLCTYTQALNPVLLETANVNLAGRLDNFGLDTIRGTANLALQVQQGNLTLDSRITQGTINASVLASQLALNPFLPGVTVPVPVQLVRTRATLSGSIEQLLNQNWNTLQANADIRLRVADDPVLISAEVQQGTLQAIVNTQQIALSPFVPNLTVPVSIQETEAIISGSINQLLNLNFNSLSADANVRLSIANSPARLIANINNGIIEAVANVGSVSLNGIIPQLPLPATLTSAQGNLTGNLNALFTSVLERDLDLNTITGNLNLQLAVADGTVNALTQLRNNQWQASITGTDINTSQLVTTFVPNLQQQYITTLADANAQLRLTGPVAPIFNPDQPLPITAQTVSIQLGEQNLNARGDIVVSNLFTRPDASANLIVQAQARNLDQLPTSQLLTSIPGPQGFLPRRLDLAGDANFQGRFIAENILTAPTAPGNLQLAGNVELIDFALNDRQFDPVLRGDVNLALGQEIAINLRGQQDIIAAVAEPCTRANCIAPYLPVSFTFRQFTEGQPPILAQGRRIGERLLADIESFPLQVLGIAPFQDYGVPGIVQGIVSLEADVNLFTLAGRGELLVNEPGVGNFQADSISANVAYQDQIASLTGATLVTGESEYNAEGSLNFATGAIFARANVDDGNIEDLLAVVGTPDIATAISLIQRQPPDLTVKDLPVYSQGIPNAPIADQVNLYARVAQYIKALAQQRQQFGVPTELAFQGVYQANLTLGGTLRDPNVNFQFQGNNWTWNPQLPYPNIIPPIGFLLQDSRTIPINEVTLQASFNDGVVAIEPARLRIQNTVLFLAAQTNLLNGNLSGNFGVEDLSTDTVNNFAEVPIDLFGNLDVKGNLSGTLFNPTVTGNFSFDEVAYNARLLEQNLVGNFQFTDGRFQLATTDPSFVGVYASIPYPPLADSDRVEVRLNLGTQALELIDIFTGDQVSWVGGDGRVDVSATGRLVLEEGVNISDLVVNGEVVLVDATVSSAALPDVLNVDGRIIFDRQLLNVEQLSATFAESQIAVAGVLPFFEPLPANNPLTVVIQQGDFDLENLYAGQIDGKVVVNGSALEPVIGGAVRLYDGRVLIPERGEQQQATPVANRWQLAATRIQSAPIAPRLNNFQVILENLRIEQDPLYQFNFGGQIAINGTFSDLNSLEPTGVIQLNRGIVNFIDTRFLLDRRYENQIVFNRDQGLLNPFINVRMRTIISDFPNLQRQQRSEFSNDIPDDSLNQVRRIDVNLRVDGQLSQLLPGFGRDIGEVCEIFPENPPIPGQNVYTQQQLEQLETCLRSVATIDNGEANEQLLASPAVSLTSSPPIGEAEIIRLLGNQFFEVAEALQGRNTAQLLEYGVVQLAFPLVFQNIAYDIENSVANALNIADFRFLPYLETVYRVNKNDESFVRVTYDYNFNEVRVQYETRF